MGADFPFTLNDVGTTRMVALSRAELYTDRSVSGYTGME